MQSFIKETLAFNSLNVLCAELSVKRYKMRQTGSERANLDIARFPCGSSAFIPQFPVSSFCRLNCSSSVMQTCNTLNSRLAKIYDISKECKPL